MNLYIEMVLDIRIACACHVTLCVKGNRPSAAATAAAPKAPVASIHRLSVCYRHTCEQRRHISSYSCTCTYNVTLRVMIVQFSLRQKSLNNLSEIDRFLLNSPSKSEFGYLPVRDTRWDECLGSRGFEQMVLSSFKWKLPLVISCTVHLYAVPNINEFIFGMDGQQMIQLCSENWKKRDAVDSARK